MSARMDEWRAEQARKNADPAYSMCENHDAAGECDAECLALVQAMSGDDYSEPMVYGDYLGGTSSIDVSGCHTPAPAAEERAMLDPVRRRIYYVTIHEWHTAEHGEVTAYVGAVTENLLTLVTAYESSYLRIPDGGTINEAEHFTVPAGTRLTVAKATTEQLTKEP